MKNYGIYTVWTKCWEGLSGGPDGYSIKKMLSALFGTVTVILELTYANHENLIAVITINVGAIGSWIIVRAIEKNNVLKNGPEVTAESK